MTATLDAAGVDATTLEADEFWWRRCGTRTMGMPDDLALEARGCDEASASTKNEKGTKGVHTRYEACKLNRSPQAVCFPIHPRLPWSPLITVPGHRLASFHRIARERKRYDCPTRVLDRAQKKGGRATRDSRGLQPDQCRTPRTRIEEWATSVVGGGVYNTKE